MRLAVLSDIHADVHALTDALREIDRLGCEHIVCAGDLVDYGLFPEETLQLLRDRGIPCIRGNHDRWAVGRERSDAVDDARAVTVHDTTGYDLSPEAVAFLAALPTQWDAVLEGVRVAVRHGTPRSDMTGVYPHDLSVATARTLLDAANADVLLVGHTHVPFAAALLGGGLIANPGALLRDPAEAMFAPTLLGLPDDAQNATVDLAPGTFGVLELPWRRFRVYRARDGAEVTILRPTPGVFDRRAR